MTTLMVLAFLALGVVLTRMAFTPDPEPSPWVEPESYSGVGVSSNTRRGVGR